AAGQQTSFMERAGLTGRVVVGIILAAADGAGDQQFVPNPPHPASISPRCRRPPTRKASGMIRSSIPSDAFQPRSFAIISTLAMQGIKSVIVTMATTTCRGESSPLDSIK